MNLPKIIKITVMNYEVVADLYEGSDQHVVLVLVGYTSTRRRYQRMLASIAVQTGATLLSFDYSGHGDSPLDLDDTMPAQHFIEVITVFDWLKAKYPNAKFTVIGRSYGGYQTLQLIKYRIVESLILQIPSIYKPQDFYTKWSELEKSWDERKSYRQDTDALEQHPLFKRALGFSGKSLVVVHSKDE